FVGYSEFLPSVGSDVEFSGPHPNHDDYARKHNPWVNWQNDAPTSPNQLPSSVNQPFTSFPTDFTHLPTVSIVVPGQYNDMHSGSVQDADSWLKDHLDSYVQWAKSNNSLLVVTFDENDGSPANHIPTIFVGPMVLLGSSDGLAVNHFGVLRTLEDMYGLPA